MMGESTVFEKRGLKRKWMTTAKASVVVWSDQVSKPASVRYAWADNPACNLYNTEVLPASPFRTDDWPAK